MVVAEVFAKDPAQVSLIEHDDVVQTIPAYGTDDTFDKWILPRRTRRAKRILYRQALDTLSDSFAVDGIAISQQITRGRIERKGLNDLLGSPSSGRVLGHVEVHDFATVMA